MILTQAYRTLDGRIFETAIEAIRHLEHLQTPVADKILKELTACDGKYGNFVALLQDSNFLNLAANLREITADQEEQKS